MTIVANSDIGEIVRRGETIMAVLEESSMQEQAEELSIIISRLATILGTIREGFKHLKSLPGDDLVKQLQDLLEEIAFSTVREDEAMIGRAIKSRSRVFRYQSILSHLKIVTATISSLVEEQQKLFSGKFSLSEKAVEQTDILFTQQEMILCTLAETIRTGDELHLRAVCSACNEFIRICRQSTNEHEKRVGKGLCLPASATYFLTILDGMRSLVHHEQEIVKLLVRWKRTNQNLFP